MTRRRGILYVTGALLIVGPPALWIVSSIPSATLIPKADVARSEQYGSQQNPYKNLLKDHQTNKD